MKQNHCFRNIVERQRPSPEVQIHSYSVATGNSDRHTVLVVLKRAGRVGAVQAPGFGVVSQLAVAPSSVPVHAFVADADGNPSGAGPLYLPVAASGNSSSTQHLRPVGEAVRVFGVGLRLGPRGHPSATVGEGQVGVGCAGVQRYVIVVWTQRMDAVRLSTAVHWDHKVRLPVHCQGVSQITTYIVGVQPLSSAPSWEVCQYLLLSERLYQDEFIVY